MTDLALQLRISEPLELGLSDPQPPPAPWHHFPFNFGPSLSGKGVVDQIRSGLSFIRENETRQMVELELIPYLQAAVRVAFDSKKEFTLIFYLKLVKLVDLQPDDQV